MHHCCAKNAKTRIINTDNYNKNNNATVINENIQPFTSLCESSLPPLHYRLLAVYSIEAFLSLFVLDLIILDRLPEGDSSTGVLGEELPSL